VPLTPFNAIVGPDFPLSFAAIVSGILKSTASETAPAAKVENAATSVSVIAAQVAKLKIHAPTEGVIAVIVAESGEAIIPGQPILTLEATGRRWTSFNLREDQFGELRIGTQVELLLAGGVDRIAAQVTEIIPRGEFAVWRAARVVGDHDLNTFLVRADPIDTTAAGLQPGMTVWLQIP
jgi:HlyD family secretion protein